MLVRKIFCPDCGVSRPASHAPGHGQLYECPGCRLLFIPAAEDVRWIEVAEARRPDEVTWAEGHRPPVDYRRPVRRFYRVDAPAVLAGVFVAAAVILGAAGVVVFTAYVSRAEPQPDVAAAPALPAPPAPDPDAAGPPAPPAPAVEPAGTSALTSASEPWLGDWDADGPMLAGLGPSAAYSLSLRPGGSLTVRCRSGTDLETVEGTWALSAPGTAPRLRLSVPDATGAPRPAMWTFQFEGTDRLTLAGPGGSVIFRRR